MPYQSYKQKVKKLKVTTFSRLPKFLWYQHFPFLWRQEDKIDFLDFKVVLEEDKFITTIYCKPTFSGIYSNFERFLPSVLKFRMIYTFVYRRFRISSHWKKYHTELTYLKKIFHKNGYIENFHIFYFLSTLLKKTY